MNSSRIINLVRKKCRMITWDEIKKKQTSISENEVKFIESWAKLCVRRIKSNTSQNEIAQRIGIPVTELAKMENLDIMPTVPILNAYAAAFKTK